MTVRWSLFADESGTFASGDPSLVAGLVVEGAADAYAGGRLRALLEDIWGPGPWPPHASHLRFPASRVVYALRRGKDDMVSGRVGAEARHAVRELAGLLAESRMAARVEQLREGAFPTHEDCREADVVLRRHPAWKVLAKVRDDQDRAMGELVAAVCARGDGFVVAALADGAPPDSEPLAPLALREDAYVRAVVAAAERTARLAGAHDVECFVLTRTVEVGGLGSIAMQGRLLAPLLERAVSETGSAAHLRPGGATFHYRDYASKGVPLHPLFVLADWIASGLRRVVRGRRGDFRSFAAAVEADLVPRADLLRRRPARAPELGPLPTFAAAGAPEDAIRAAFAGRGADLLEGGWVWDQARAWVDAAGRWS